MKRIGLFFGTDTGSTRLVAKMIARKLGDNLCSKPQNVNRIKVEDMLIYDALILGTPSYGDGQLPGKSSKVANGSWEEFLTQLHENDFRGKTVALYGLGDQEKYSDRFVNGMYELYRILGNYGATFTGKWNCSGYQFDHSKAVIDNQFLGLVLDQSNQRLLTESRLDAWLNQILPVLLPLIEQNEAAIEALGA